MCHVLAAAVSLFRQIPAQIADMFLIGVFAVGIMQIDPLGGRITVGCHLFRKILIEEFDLFLTDLSGNSFNASIFPVSSRLCPRKYWGPPTTI